MSILVATDLSPCSQAAVRLATALAHRRGVPLLLMHAVEHPAVVDIPAAPMGPTGWEANLVTAAEIAVAREASEPPLLICSDWSRTCPPTARTSIPQRPQTNFPMMTPVSWRRSP